MKHPCQVWFHWVEKFCRGLKDKKVKDDRSKQTKIKNKTKKAIKIKLKKLYKIKS
jgi:hypothetical protein